ncbi:MULTISPECIES: mechanosensitive ion channel family protein [Sphingobacterium]|uniref:Mechanosensitive ion channel family protein n=1 Tax=Sphingobacterium paramultivorum TaxID=2886510 RepID=A0A7G5DY24_9SPHI|nr:MULTISPECIES: mechanosensitive ion channel family protein [Sphingobacterium]MBB1647049.1 mechanosensitive ion channel protein MscS [Sphingobacterium sp. UME9]MCS4163444.1 small conductance mechanosensitive channel [Sphingobacterium sp. BIGb0116]QMV66649.1 mechanosensitive ion channel family protein [Sphingobacterium paramultivorum]WET67422.1 MAG: mechanosensitive ion channel family protein [Sphingobacterium sp.]WSO15471.1 mechanosensitive ion channel family protein [Sphingobacterium paramul
MESNLNSLETRFGRLTDIVIESIPGIIGGIILLILGKYVIGFVDRLLHKRFERKNVDPSIRAFISSIVKIVMWVMLLLTVASQIGIQTTSFIAALSAFGLAVGMALQGSLSNFAGGVLILMFRPFEVGDSISSANGTAGTVERIDILYSTLIGDDGVRVFSPNGPLANSVIKNYTKIVQRMFEYTISISYDKNVKEAKDIILRVLRSNENVLTTPEPTVFIKELGDSAMVLTVRAWTKREHYVAARNSMQEKIMLELERNDISLSSNPTQISIVSNSSDQGTAKA